MWARWAHASPGSHRNRKVCSILKAFLQEPQETHRKCERESWKSFSRGAGGRRCSLWQREPRSIPRPTALLTEQRPLCAGGRARAWGASGRRWVPPGWGAEPRPLLNTCPSASPVKQKRHVAGAGGGGGEGNGMVTAGTAQRWEPMRRHRNTSKQGAREPGEGGERDTCGRATFPPGPRRSLENGRERAWRLNSKSQGRRACLGLRVRECPPCPTPANGLTNGK